MATAARQRDRDQDDCVHLTPVVCPPWTSSSRRSSGRSRRSPAISRPREIEPNAAEWDRAHAFPRRLLTQLGELGLMGVCVPEEYGGAGADFLSYILVLEELSRADAGVGVTVAVHTSACSLPILQFGTEEQRARFVPPLARGEGVGCFALTEPGSGSDAGALLTRAERTDAGWHISGAKQWITNASFGGTCCSSRAPIRATRTRARCVGVHLDTDQVTITRTEEKLGLNSSATNDIAIDSRRRGRSVARRR